MSWIKLKSGGYLVQCDCCGRIVGAGLFGSRSKPFEKKEPPSSWGMMKNGGDMESYACGRCCQSGGVEIK